MKVYLAGGLRSGWQDAMPTSKNIEYLDPRSKNEAKMDLPQIQVWDFHKIKESDVVFAYMEKTNPSGFGLATEIGFAYGIGKTVILVLEKENQIQKDKYLAFITKAANITFESIDEGMKFLASLIL